MKRKHERTLEAIFTNPISGNIQWRSIETLLKVLGAEVTEGQGSRVHVSLQMVNATFHRPHPSPDTDKGAVVAVRKLLKQVNVKPGDDYVNDAV